MLVALFGLMWLLLIRPQRRRTQAQMVMQDQLRAGDEIITAGGLHATVRSIEDDVLEVELGPNMTVRLDRRAVAAVVTEPEIEPARWPTRLLATCGSKTTGTLWLFALRGLSRRKVRAAALLPTATGSCRSLRKCAEVKS